MMTTITSISSIKIELKIRYTRAYPY
jgi:hypothetical protein